MESLAYHLDCFLIFWMTFFEFNDVLLYLLWFWMRFFKRFFFSSTNYWRRVDSCNYFALFYLRAFFFFCLLFFEEVDNRFISDLFRFVCQGYLFRFLFFFGLNLIDKLFYNIILRFSWDLTLFLFQFLKVHKHDIFKIIFAKQGLVRRYFLTDAQGIEIIWYFL